MSTSINSPRRFGTPLSPNLTVLRPTSNVAARSGSLKRSKSSLPSPSALILSLSPLKISYPPPPSLLYLHLHPSTLIITSLHPSNPFKELKKGMTVLKVNDIDDPSLEDLTQGTSTRIVTFSSPKIDTTTPSTPIPQPLDTPVLPGRASSWEIVKGDFVGLSRRVGDFFNDVGVMEEVKEEVEEEVKKEEKVVEAFEEKIVEQVAQPLDTSTPLTFLRTHERSKLLSTHTSLLHANTRLTHLLSKSQTSLTFSQTCVNELESKRDELLGLIERKDILVKGYAGNVRELQERVKEDSKKIVEAETENSREMSKLIIEKEEVEVKFRKVVNSKEILEGRLTDVLEELADLKYEVSEAKQNLEQVDGENDSLAFECDRVTDLLETAVEDKERAERERDQVKVLLEERVELKDLERKVEEKFKLEINGLKEQVDIMSNDNSRMQKIKENDTREIGKLNSKISSLEVEIDLSSTQNWEKIAATRLDSITSLNAKVACLTKEVKEGQEEREIWFTKAEESIETSKLKLIDVQSHAALAVEEANKRSFIVSKNLEGERKELEGRVGMLEGVKVALLKQVEEGRREKEDARRVGEEARKGEIESLSAFDKFRTEKSEELTTVWSRVEALESDLKSEINMKDIEAKDLLHRIHQLEVEVEEEREEREMGRGREGMLEVENEELRVKVGRFEEEVEMNTAKIMMKEVEGRLFEALDMVEGREREIETLKVQLEAKEENLMEEEIYGGVEKLKVEEAEGRAYEAIDMVEVRDKEIEQLMVHCTGLSREMEKVKETKVLVERELGAMKKQCEILDKKYRGIKTELEVIKSRPTPKPAKSPPKKLFSPRKELEKEEEVREKARERKARVDMQSIVNNLSESNLALKQQIEELRSLKTKPNNKIEEVKTKLLSPSPKMSESPPPYTSPVFNKAFREELNLEAAFTNKTPSATAHSEMQQRLELLLTELDSAKLGIENRELALTEMETLVTSYESERQECLTELNRLESYCNKADKIVENELIYREKVEMEYCKVLEEFKRSDGVSKIVGKGVFVVLSRVFEGRILKFKDCSAAFSRWRSFVDQERKMERGGEFKILKDGLERERRLNEDITLTNARAEGERHRRILEVEEECRRLEEEREREKGRREEIERNGREIVRSSVEIRQSLIKEVTLDRARMILLSNHKRVDHLLTSRAWRKWTRCVDGEKSRDAAEANDECVKAMAMQLEKGGGAPGTPGTPMSDAEASICWEFSDEEEGN
ncbi:hypothetical protein TL16_g10080 [Triparma laevis f. inornata]|uniref:Uncharacterized protein n=1 Tax=Triparma laevis f. inornata TaxID=1714386 RepID=A0A9W7EL95_9STRA|nr:hypothetical protein TL16_g10080 [Triparma laevis f. inornata]